MDRSYPIRLVSLAASLATLLWPFTRVEAVEPTIVEANWDAASDRGEVVVALAERRLRCDVLPRAANPDDGYRLRLMSKTPEFQSSETSHCLEIILLRLKGLGCDVAKIRMVYLPRLLDADIRAKLGSAFGKQNYRTLSNDGIVSIIRKTDLFQSYDAAFNRFELTVTPDSVEKMGLLKSNKVDKPESSEQRMADGKVWLSVRPRKVRP